MREAWELGVLSHSLGSAIKSSGSCGERLFLLQSCLTLCNPEDCSLPGSSVHGISQARLLQWVVMSFSHILVLKQYLCIWLCRVLVVVHRSYFYYFDLLIYFFYSFAGYLLLCGIFSSCGEQGLLSSCGAAFSLWWLLLWSTGFRALTFSCPTACGVFPDQGSNLCPLQWKHWILTTEPPGKFHDGSLVVACKSSHPCKMCLKFMVSMWLGWRMGSLWYWPSCFTSLGLSSLILWQYT